VLGPLMEENLRRAMLIARGDATVFVTRPISGGLILVAVILLVIINLPLVGVWVSLLRVPYRLLFPSIIVFCCIGIYSINNSASDVLIAAAFGLFGYWLVKHDFEPAPLVLAFVLGPLMEENLRRAMLIARGDPSVFVTRPISAGLLFVAAVMLALAMLPLIRKRRDEVFVE
jgi:putative tricarboxylic transport membrane protein